jgi:hypothetical protein
MRGNALKERTFTQGNPGFLPCRSPPQRCTIARCAFSDRVVMNEKVRSAAGVIALIVLAVGTYIGYQRFTQRHHVADLVRDTAARLNASLNAEASGAPSPDAEANARAVEEHGKTLRSMNASSFRPLADAADY